MTTEQVITFI